MRTASILLAFVLVLGFVREAGAIMGLTPTNDYTVRIGGNDVGFRDWEGKNQFGETGAYCQVCLGPFGRLDDVPFTAIQGLVGFWLIAMVIVFTFRWKSKRAAA
jgi:hypothetical protein